MAAVDTHAVRRPGFREISVETEQRPITEWFIGGALAALLLAAALSLLWFARLP